jgi:phosphoglycerate kinase
MKTLNDLDFAGRRVLLRADFNVPLDDSQKITDDLRIRMVLPTIRHILERKGKLILCSHLGRPGGRRDEKLSLAPVAKELQACLGTPITLALETVGSEVEALAGNLGEGETLLLENLRFSPRETENDSEFAKQLAGLAEVYVNDAFAVSHRAHASTVGVPLLMSDKGCGFLLQKELEYFHRALSEPLRPLVAVVGGAKVSSKLGALQNMLSRVDRMIIGGAMANTFLRSMGVNLGNSMVEEDLLEAAKDFVEAAEKQGVRLYFPVDFIVADSFSPMAVTKTVTFRDIPDSWMALDIGPASTILFREALQDAKTIVWNGPMGAFEMDSFAGGTMAMCRDIAGLQALSIVGGGDSNAAVKKAGEEHNISYMSTGGGAFLQLMEGKTLPGVEALKG